MLRSCSIELTFACKETVVEEAPRAEADEEVKISSWRDNSFGEFEILKYRNEIPGTGLLPGPGYVKTSGRSATTSGFWLAAPASRWPAISSRPG